MSADEFDPGIERLFAQAPVMADSDAFARTLEQRLESGRKVRLAVLVAATVGGAALALKETLSAPLATLLPWRLGDELQATSSGVGSRLQQGLSLGEMRLGELVPGGLGVDMATNPTLFWVVAFAVVALASMAVMRLSQEL